VRQQLQAKRGKTDNILQIALLSWRRSLTAWLHVPVGVLIILLACFGIDSLIGLSSVSFPASVAVLILLFLSLILLDFVLGDRKTRSVVNMIDVPVSCVLIIRFHVINDVEAGFSLRYLNIFFTPS